MGIRLVWGVPVALAVALALWLPTSATAHPQLIGKWSAAVPPGGSMTFDFGPAKYMGRGIWEGPYIRTASDCPMSSGVYYLRMFTGTQGVLGLDDERGVPVRSGTVDLGAGVVTHQNVDYRR